MWHYLQKKLNLSLLRDLSVCNLLLKSFSKRQCTFFKIFIFIVVIEFVFICSLFIVKRVSNFKFFNKSKNIDVYFDLTNLNTASWQTDIKHIENKKSFSSPIKSLKQTNSKKKLVNNSKNIKKPLANKVNPKLNIVDTKNNTNKVIAKKHNVPKFSKNIVKNDKSSNKNLKKNTSKAAAKNNIVKLSKPAKTVKPAKLVKPAKPAKSIKPNKIIEKVISKTEEVKTIKDDIAKDTVGMELPKQLNLELNDNNLNLNQEIYKKSNASEIENLLKCAQQIKHEIYKHWRIPKGLIKNLSLELEYFINSYGKAEKVSILKSSGKRNYDQLLKAAIYRSTFPKELYNLNIIIKF